MEQDQEFAENIFKNFNELFFDPEIAKRKLNKQIVEPFYLIAAQAVLFSDERQPIIRINEEVKAKVKIKKDIDTTDKDFWANRHEVEEIIFDDSENLDSGHITMILFKDGYQLRFDFVYNKYTCNKYLNTAEEFLKSAKFAFENNLLSAFVDNSFSSMEFLAKAKLILEANKQMKGKTNHKAIISEFNKRYKNNLNKIENDYKIVLNKLSQLRSSARYVENSFNILENEKLLILNSMTDLHQKIKENIS